MQANTPRNVIQVSTLSSNLLRSIPSIYKRLLETSEDLICQQVIRSAILRLLHRSRSVLANQTQSKMFPCAKPESSLKMVLLRRNLLESCLCLNDFISENKGSTLPNTLATNAPRPVSKSAKVQS